MCFIAQGTQPRKWTKSFNKWMETSLEVQPSSADAFSMYRRGCRAKGKYLQQLLDAERIDEPAPDSPSSWGLAEARKEFNLDEEEAKTSVEKVAAYKEKDRKRKRESKKDKEGKKGPPASCASGMVLAMPTDSALATSLKAMQESKSVLETQHDEAVEKLKSLEQSKAAMAKQVPITKAAINSLTPTAKRIPSIKAQLDREKEKLSKMNYEQARIDVAISKAKDVVKKTASELRKMDADEVAVQKQVDLERARAESSDDDMNVPIMPLPDLFKLMDRKDLGAVSKTDFIEALAQGEVSSFFGLPSSLKQEDGSRDRMEEVFQKIAGANKSFSLSDFEEAYAPCSFF